jgi:hypothetical protein
VRFDDSQTEGVGFEPTRCCHPPVFKTGAFNRSAIPPTRNKIQTRRRGRNPGAQAYVES